MSLSTPLLIALLSGAAPGAPTLNDIVALGAVAAPPAPAAAPPATASSVEALLSQAGPNAAPSPNATPPLSAYVRGDPDFGGPLKAVGFLALLGGGLFLYLKRRQNGGVASRGMRVLDRVALGKNRELLMVQAGDAVMLVSSSDTGVALLRDRVQWASAEASDAAGHGGAPAAKRSSWVETLTAAVQGRIPTLDELPDEPAFASASTQGSAEDAEIRRKMLTALEASRKVRAA